LLAKTEPAREKKKIGDAGQKTKGPTVSHFNTGGEEKGHIDKEEGSRG